MDLDGSFSSTTTGSETAIGYVFYVPRGILHMHASTTTPVVVALKNYYI